MSHIPLPLVETPTEITITLIVRLFIMVASFMTFLYFRRKKEDLSFQAWALFSTVLYFGFIFNEIQHNAIFQPITRAFLSALVFFNSLIVILRQCKKKDDKIKRGGADKV